MLPSNKRQKLSVPSDPPQLSAVAARRALQGKAQASVKQSGDGHVKAQTSVTKLDATVSGDVETAFQRIPQEGVAKVTLDAGVDVVLNAGKDLDFDEGGASSFPSSRGDSPDEIPVERPSVALSSFRPTQSNFKESKNGTLSLLLVPGERLVILGQYELSVRKGQITLLGTTLQASEKMYRVFAPSSHALPVIRCLATDANEAEIHLNQCESGLGSMKSLSPLFGRLWNDGSRPLCSRFESLLRNKRKSTYQIVRSAINFPDNKLISQVFSSEDEPQKAFLQPLISLPEWNRLLAKLTGPEIQQTPITMICGPKSSGKSTFARLLANRLLSTSMGATAGTKTPGVALIDLDPGQPEYSPPGQVSLIHLQEPNFGPPYAHPSPGSKSRVVRSHAIAALTPSMDPSLYMACALDLFAHYRNLLSSVPHCPLIINTPGWVLGTGLEILMELITKVRPNGVIYMSDEGPWEVVQSLRSAAKLTSTLVYTLPSQLSEYTTRTSVHLRTMQTMSYFHLNTTHEPKLSWNCTPLTSVPPWEISYAGNNPGILGILCYGEQPPANLLADAINGSLVAVVVIDDTAAIPGWDSQERDEDTIDDGPASETPDQDDISLSQNSEIQAFDANSIHHRPVAKPLITRTLAEDLPYFNPANDISLDPQFSHTIGLALIRGIDLSRRRLQILTPIPAHDLREVNEAGKQVVLVSGKLDTPGWAYTEELYQKGSTEKEKNKVDEDAEDVDAEDDDTNITTDNKVLGASFENIPWVEKLKGSEGRGLGARVWRVRRDLGKMADGGD
ncbi:uncharacterized protein BP5553_09009 [Venustampulla echinocandica]|uniref:Polynucleotide 5'-hydroxyl-kinase GRC3 n=1 Tax=Venustampulla echinocandica TaxID=2656787 RepID=A0A370TDL1_9HELO|nr:uncharacterized protein BP5553_09009 [Venustampulla echinocandica]RDL32553.1 hypothetical protein BP5553_09009 [Venustampulla echinocandica]